MKYYAVTDDPRELYHYGVKGMKWGQHIFGDKPKSPGYKRVASKLRGLVNNRRKEEHKYEDAVKKAQKRISTIEKLYKVDQDKAVYDSINREITKANRKYKADQRMANRYSKNEAKMDKIMKKARKGTLKYGNLSPDQIERIQSRLQLEANTRKLGAAEKTWHQQKKEARRKGKLSGIERGTAAAMEEVARAGAVFGVNHALNRLKLKSKAKFEGKENKIKNKAQNKKSEREWQKEAREEMRKEAYKAQIRDPSHYGLFDNPDNLEAARYLKTLKDKEERKRLEENERKLRDDAFRKLMLGDKQNQVNIDKLKENLKNMDEYRKLVYGDSPAPTKNKSFSEMIGARIEEQKNTLINQAKGSGKALATKVKTKVADPYNAGFEAMLRDMQEKQAKRRAELLEEQKRKRRENPVRG